MTFDTLKKMVYYLFGLLIFAAFVILLKIDLSVFLSIKHIEYIIISLFLVSLFFLVLALRLRALLCSFTIQTLSVKTLLEIELVNRFFLYTLPARLNLLVKAGIISKKYELSKTNALSIITFEPLLDFWIAIVPIFFGMIFFTVFFEGLLFYMSIFVICLITLFLIIFILFKSKWFDFLIMKAKKISIALISKVFVFFLTFFRDMRKTWVLLLRSPSRIKIFYYTLLYWLISVSIPFSLFLAVGEYVNPIYIAFALSIALFAGFLSTIPGGFGVREGVMILVLSVFGIPPEATLFVVVTNRVLVLLYVFIGYIIAIKSGYSDIGKIRNFISK